MAYKIKFQEDSRAGLFWQNCDLRLSFKNVTKEILKNGIF